MLTGRMKVKAFSFTSYLVIKRLHNGHWHFMNGSGLLAIDSGGYWLTPMCPRRHELTPLRVRNAAAIPQVGRKWNKARFRRDIQIAAWWQRSQHRRCRPARSSGSRSHADRGLLAEPGAVPRDDQIVAPAACGACEPCAAPRIRIARR